MSALGTTPVAATPPPPPLSSGVARLPRLPTLHAQPPAIRVALPGGDQGELPGFVWPDLSRAVSGAGSSGGGPIVGIYQVTKRVADPFYDRWHDDLGACDRPFGRHDFELRVGSEVVAMATSCSTINRNVSGTLHRRNVVDLARIACTDRHPHALRAMLRLYRLYLAPLWDYWPIDAVVSHATPGHRGGQLYRFDGWTKIRDCTKSGGGGTWSRPSKTNKIGDGIKSLWGYAYTALPLDGQPAEPDQAHDMSQTQLALLAELPLARARDRHCA